MAPKRGGSSGSGGGSSLSSCPGAFSDTQTQVYFACVVIFFAVYVGISIALCTVRKKTVPGRKLLGAPYIFALVFFILSNGLDLISSVLLECNTVTRTSYYSLAIAINVFYLLGCWLLLFVVVYTLNTMLRQHLGRMSVVIKAILIAIVGIMFVVTIAQMSMTCYNLWVGTDAGYDADADYIIEPAEQLRTAWNVLYFLSVVVAGALSLITVFTIRSRRLPGGNLLGWVIALIFSMAVWIILGVVFAASYLSDNFNIITFETAAALTYIQSFLQALSFILLICIAKHVAWSQTATSAPPITPYAPVVQNQHIYAHNGTNGQDALYNQAPVYTGVKQ